MVFEDRQGWLDAVFRRLEELVRLDRGWDGYEGAPVSFETAVFSLQLLQAVCGPKTPAPQLVPGSSGDMQIEWHSLKGDIELHVLAPNTVRAWRSLVHDEEGECLNLTFDFGTVAKWVREITEPERATATAAA